MTDKIMYAVLNGRGLYTKKDFDHNLKDNESLYIHVPTPLHNVANAKNNIIAHARDKGVRYLFIIEDDVIVKDIRIFYEYINIMEKYNIGLTMYGYGKHNVRYGVPNPVIRMATDNSDELTFNRIHCSEVMGIDLKNNDVLFDTTLDILEIEKYVKECAANKVIPFVGFYPDVYNSYEYFEVLGESIRVRKYDDVTLERELINREELPPICADINVLVEYVMSNKF
jgi:hypothetical protein